MKHTSTHQVRYQMPWVLRGFVSSTHLGYCVPKVLDNVVAPYTKVSIHCAIGAGEPQEELPSCDRFQGLLFRVGSNSHMDHIGIFVPEVILYILLSRPRAPMRSQVARTHPSGS